MSIQEIIFRILRQTRQVIEARRVKNGWRPSPSFRVVSRKSLLPPIDQYYSLWVARFQLDISTLDDLCLGNIELFGHEKVSIAQPHNWHLDPISSVCSPKIFGKSIDYRNADLVGDTKVVWELGRQHYLIPVAVAYAITGEERYLSFIVKEIESWVEQNPFAIGIHWCSSLESALRLISWAIVHSLISSRLGGEGLFKVVGNPVSFGHAIYQQAWFIRHFLSQHSSAGNHLIGELAGLWIVCQVFELGEEGKKWGQDAQRELEQQLSLQVFPDGVGKEQALYYHLWVLEYGLFLLAAGQKFGFAFSNEFGTKLSTMADFIRDVTPCGGQPPQIGDADDGFVSRFTAAWPSEPYRDVLGAETVLCTACLPHHLSEKAFWYGLMGGEIELLKGSDIGRARDKTYPRVYAEGGYAILGNDECHLVFDAGSLGYLSIAAHGHADALNFVLAIDGSWWFVDPGTYKYHDDHQWRNYFRSTRAHNCLTVDDRNQSSISGPFMWSNHAQAELARCESLAIGEQHVVGAHNGYVGIGVTHIREIRLNPMQKEIDIIDRLEGHGSHKINIWFQLAPNIVPKQQGGTWVLEKKGGSRTLHLQLDPRFSWQAIIGDESPEIVGWYSSRLGHREPSYTLCGERFTSVPITIDSKIHYK